ncbi:MAG: 2-keto-4-pentenoate hydratase [Alphaproteobacteria bacterium]|nr:2-keto-4-pentenoate hydratase [Alphaproteobacteria bacterium]
MTDSILEAARLLRAARRGAPLAALPEPLRPADADGAYAIQRTLVAGEAIGGWKVGIGPDGKMFCAPMPQAGIVASPAKLGAGRMRGIEAEVSFRVGTDLPPRATPYGREEVIAALPTAHPAIEVLESAYEDGDKVDPLSRLADLVMHGGYVYGPGLAAWHGLDFPNITVTQTIDADVMQRTGNPAGDMIRLVMWLADAGATWAGGLKAGQIVTCGSWTGKTLAGPGARVSVVFPGLGEASVAFAG